MIVSQVVHRETGSVIADIHRNTVTFRSPLFRQNLQLSGINIPHGLRGNFSGRRVVPYDDPSFLKAFIEVYFPAVFQNQGYDLKHSHEE